ncbi:hypothetical protein F7725_012919, partial [Dissostichus mawsoni]
WKAESSSKRQTIGSADARARHQQNEHGVYNTQEQTAFLWKAQHTQTAVWTSERRTSFFDARRTSGVSLPRNSNMSGFGGSEKIKDSRPLHDKAFVLQCTRQLHEARLPRPLVSQDPRVPLHQGVVKVFEFVYRQIDPTFQMPNSKVEEEVPALLKTLRYPFVLSKSSMYSVGAPHTWPLALGALTWMIDHVKLVEDYSAEDTPSS